MQERQVIVQAPSAPGGPVIVGVGSPAGVPTTREEYRALVDKRSELSNQLISASGRRDELAQQLNTVHPDARPGLLDRLRVLDDRIVKLETEIERTGVQLANTPPALTTRTVVSQAPGLGTAIGRNIVPITGIISTFVLLPLAIAMARQIWRRGSAPPRAALTEAGTQRQLEQMQQSIDAIAIEVERISENQRYVTRMMSDRALGGGVAEPVRGARPAIPVERG